MPHLERPAGARLYYETSAQGKGAPCVFSHGYGASARMWRPQTEALEGARPWLVWDNRGHGLTQTPADAEMSHDGAMDDVDALCAVLGGAKVALVGHSMGGYLTLAYALARPQAVAAVVLVGAGPGFRSDDARGEWNAYAEKVAQRLEARGLVAADGGPETADAQHSDARALARAARGLLAHQDARVMERLDTLAVPTLIIVGENDKRFMPASQYMARKIPDARLEIIPDAGHAPNLDAPERFNALLIDFLDAVA